MIIKAALLLFREQDGVRQLLFARAKGKPYYIFPGGKQEAGETIEEALARELDEELGSGVTTVKKLGDVTGVTPDGRPLCMHLFTGELTDDPHAQAEIEELLWLSRQEALEHQDKMTPMTRDHVFPFLQEHKLW